SKCCWTPCDVQAQQNQARSVTPSLRPGTSTRFSAASRSPTAARQCTSRWCSSSAKGSWLLSMNDQLTIRTMTPAEVEMAVDWAVAEGWTPGFTGAATFLAGGPEGFITGLVVDEPVAAISAVRYGR